MIRLFIFGLITVICGCNKFRESRQFDSLFRITTIGEQKQSQSNLADFNKCMNDLKYALTPGGIDLLGQMLLNSAKFINQYGDPDACRDNPNTEYVILKVMGIPIGLEIGICAPAGCDSQEVYYGLTQYANNKMKEMNITGMEVKVILPYSASVDHSLSTGAIIVILLTSLIVILGIIGIFVEYFPLFEKPQSLPTEKIEERKTKLGLLFYSFSFKNNLQKLFEVSDRGDANLKILNGIRVLSICWITVGHTFTNVVADPVTNFSTALDISKGILFTLVPGGYYAVDVFFFLSGFLTFYLLTIKMYPKRGCDNYFILYFHRWFRLFTPVLYCMLLCIFVFKYFGSGPKFFDHWNVGCDKYWWSSLIFINNLYPWNGEEMCIGWYWYLANDFQFFLVSPIIITIYCLNRYGGYALLGFLCLFNYVYSMVITAKFNFGIFITFSDKENFMHWLYLKPWVRFATYGIGALLGWAYFEYNYKDKHPQFQRSIWTKMFSTYKISGVLSYISFIIGLFLTSFIIFIQYDFYQNELAYNNWDKFPCMIYNAFARSAFIIGLVLIILPTFENRLSWIKTFLGSDFMCVLGRLTFGVYLMHIPWMRVYLADLRQGSWLNNLNQWFLSFATLIITFLFVIPFSMICEVPFMNLEKYFLMPQSKKKNQSKQENYNKINDKTLDETNESEISEMMIKKK